MLPKQPLNAQRALLCGRNANGLAPISPDINSIAILWAIIKQIVHTGGKQFYTLHIRSILKNLKDSVNDILFDLTRCQGAYINKLLPSFVPIAAFSKFSRDDRKQPCRNLVFFGNVRKIINHLAHFFYEKLALLHCKLIVRLRRK